LILALKRTLLLKWPSASCPVSYDDILLVTRQMVLEKSGYEVISALGFTKAVEY
jgi:hypothetical protein